MIDSNGRFEMKEEKEKKRVEKKKSCKKNKIVKAAACVGGCAIATIALSSLPGKIAKKDLDDVFKD